MTPEALKAVLQEQIDGLAIKKIVFSRPTDKSVLRADARLIMLKSGLNLQVATYMADGKALHRNIPSKGCADQVYKFFEEGFRQMNIITSGGDIQAMLSKSGQLSTAGKIEKALEKAESNIGGNDKKRGYIIEEKPTPFLEKLGVMDKNGRVFDKKRAKFRQINKFLEIVGDTVSRIDHDGSICVYDLCCGKGYLTFALYHYLKNILGLDARVYGVDLKGDVIEKCGAWAEELGFEGLTFICDNIENIRPKNRVDMVVALHACDIATDIAIAHAVKWNSQALLSAPCCQHELSKQMKADVLDGMFRQNILRYRFAQLATDTLRCELLECCSYSVTAMEFIDPDETDKNLMIKALRQKKPLSADKVKNMVDQYKKRIDALGVSPTLFALLRDRLF